MEYLESCGSVFARSACTTTEECDPATTACRELGSGGFCTECSSNLDCASRLCSAGGYCTYSCTGSADCPSGFSCSGGQCVGTTHDTCSSDRNSIVRVNACGNVVSTTETCTGDDFCRYFSDGVTPFCGFACQQLNDDSHTGTGHCTYTRYNRTTGQCCGSCIDYSCPECGPFTWDDCATAR